MQPNFLGNRHIPVIHAKREQFANQDRIKVYKQHLKIRFRTAFPRATIDAYQPVSTHTMWGIRCVVLPSLMLHAVDPYFSRYVYKTAGYLHRYDIHTKADQIAAIVHCQHTEQEHRN